MPTEPLKPKQKAGRAAVERQIPRPEQDRMMRPRNIKSRIAVCQGCTPYREENWPTQRAD